MGEPHISAWSKSGDGGRCATVTVGGVTMRVATSRFYEPDGRTAGTNLALGPGLGVTHWEWKKSSIKRMNSFISKRENWLPLLLSMLEARQAAMSELAASLTVTSEKLRYDIQELSNSTTCVDGVEK